MKVAFVSCVKTKADRPMPAKDLYVSPWFRMARHFVEEHAHRWFILSSAWGLLRPDELVGPYDSTLNRMGMLEKRTWSALVDRQMDQFGVRGDHALVLAGKTYRRFAMPSIVGRFGVVEVPMFGLKMGQQLSWLSERTE